MTRGRPELPDSHIININDVIRKINSEIFMKNDGVNEGLDIEIVFPVYQSQTEEIAKNCMWLLDKKIYISERNRSSYNKPLEFQAHGNTYYIFDKFKSESRSHKSSYYHTVQNSENESGPIFMPVYWRIN